MTSKRLRVTFEGVTFAVSTSWLSKWSDTVERDIIRRWSASGDVSRSNGTCLRGSWLNLSKVGRKLFCVVFVGAIEWSCSSSTVIHIGVLGFDDLDENLIATCCGLR